MFARVVGVRAAVLSAALMARCAISAQPAGGPIPDLESRQEITPSEPSVIWRNDGEELPPNAFGKVRNAFSADGRLIGVVRQPQEAWLLNASDGSLFYTLPCSSSPWGAYSIAFSPSGEFAVGRLHAVEVFDARGRSVRVIEC